MTNNTSNNDSDPGTSASQAEERAPATTKPISFPVTANEGTASLVDGPTAAMSENNTDPGFRGDPATRRKLSRLLQGKEHEWTAVAQKKGPLQLLDLPMDILKEIIKEVTHTNDLTSLALTHSALHSLAIPHIYSRFDIVWPEATSTDESRTGVDALTYGLSTLVMGHDVFGPGPIPPYGSWGQSRATSHEPVVRTPTGATIQRRLGNHYSHFTRKFSLGNGPSAWVKEYMITKESGKMLGTLVALAVARMVNLETFVWDMPTGVLRDVWLTLSSLQYKSPPGECHLERVLVRWHDNSYSSDEAPSPTGSAQSPLASIHNSLGTTVTSIGILVPSDVTTSSTMTVNEHRYRVEHPTLSVLPPLKALSVLDIDELSYLDEMSFLIEKSKDRLRELRVGISKKAHSRPFVLAWDGPGLHQVAHDAKSPSSSASVDEKRLGGVLGVLLGRTFDIRKKSKLVVRTKNQTLSDTTSAGVSPTLVLPLTSPLNVGSPVEPSADVVVQITSEGSPAEETPNVEFDLEKLGSEPLIDNVDNLDLNVSSSITSPAVEISQLDLSQTQPTSHPLKKNNRSDNKAEGRTSGSSPSCERKRLNGILRLRILELERVPLSIYVLQKAFDWSTITSLTILDCAYHESLWRMLRQQFQPRPRTNGSYAQSSSRHGLSTSSKAAASANMEYRLNLKKIHTDVATPALISFLKETLAPDTLEVLFLQDRRKNTTGYVTIDAIYRGPLRRHRRSLKKLMIDSSDKVPKGPGFANDSTRWRSWMLTHDVLAYISSGNMPNLRELAVAIEYKDWHFLLRRLPQMSGLRSLNIPFIADHVTPSYEPKELALQVVDMIFLRPEIELCYLGISNKCFEILENRPQDSGAPSADLSGNGMDEDGEQPSDDEDDEDEDDDDDDDVDDEAATEDGEDDGTAAEAVEADSLEYDPSEHGDSDNESLDGVEDDKTKLSLRLREILFYDDKVAIFKARHNRL